MSYTPTYKRPYEQWKELPSKETLVTAEVLTQYDDTFENIEGYLESEGKKEYALVTEAGYSIVASIDEYYVLTVVLKNKAGEVLSTSEPIDLPIESMIINVDYDEESGILTFSLQNGQTLDVNISTLVRGLVPTSRKIAGVDLEDDITADELKTALGVFDSTVTAGELKPWLYSKEETLASTYNGKPLYRKVLEPIEVTEDRQKYSIADIPYDKIMIDLSSSFSIRGGATFPITNIGYDTVTDTVAGGATQHAYITDDSSITFRKANAITSYTAYITLQYTKTTDLEGSGNNLNPYGIYDAKLDDVKSSIASVSDEVDAVEAQIEVVKNNVFARLRAATDIDALDLPYAVLSTSQASTGTFPVGASKIGVVEVIKRTDQYIIQRYTDVGLNTTYLRWYLGDETGWRSWEQLGKQSDIDAINSRLAYKDISSSIDVGDTGCTAKGYVENGCVALYVLVPAGSTEAIQLSIDTAYAPRFASGGSLASISAVSDMGKMMGNALSNGTIGLYISGTLAADEIMSFTYPLKSS